MKDLVINGEFFATAQSAAKEKPEDPSMWFALGVVKDNLKKVDEAEAASDNPTAALRSLHESGKLITQRIGAAVADHSAFAFGGLRAGTRVRSARTVGRS